MHIIPQPLFYQEQEGVFRFSPQTQVVCDVPFIKNLLEKSFSELKGEGDKTKSISAVLSNQAMEEEEYRIKITPQKAVLYAGTEAGLFYAVQTLKQILFQTKGAVPSMEISDKPLIKNRSFMLDVGRYFFKTEDVKKIIDLIAMHKFNILHLHLTEDQGWRVEIKKYPKLTEIGSKRSHTNFGRKAHGGFYTQKEIKELVEYALKRNVKIIPEIDMPGHMVAAIAAYPHLSCFDRELPVATHFGVKHDILCMGKESTFEFVTDVLDEIVKLFPYRMVHLGGDEAVKMRTKLCPHCQKAMAEKGLQSEDELQDDFINRVAAYLKKKHRTSMVWNNMGASRLSGDILWDYYHENEENKKELLQRGYFNCTSKAYYLDLPYGKISLEQCYKKDAHEFGGNMKGIEAALWSEYVPHLKKAFYMTFPRLGAVSESAWGIDKPSYERFMEKMDFYYAYLQQLGVTPATLKRANPQGFAAFCSRVWFEKRQLHWQPIHNLFDDAKVSLIAKKVKKQQKTQKEAGHID